MSLNAVHPVRLRELKISNFKGFQTCAGEPVSIDLDADVVLLTGPNGYGKTSVIEALEVLFTGRCVDRLASASETPVKRRSSRTAEEPYSLQLINRDAGATEAALRCQVGCSGSGCRPGDVMAEVSRDGGIKSDITARLAEWGWGEFHLDDLTRDLLRDSAFYYQDGLNAFMRLESAAQSAIVDALIPRPSLVGALSTAAQRAVDELSGELREIDGGRPAEDIEQECAVAASQLQDALARCSAEYEQPQFIGSSGKLYAEARVGKALTTLSRSLGADIRTGGRHEWPAALTAIADEADRQATLTRGTPQPASDADEMPHALSLLPPQTPWPGAIEDDLRQLGSRSVLAEQLEEATQSVARDQNRISLLSASGVQVEPSTAAPRRGLVLVLQSLLQVVSDKDSGLAELVAPYPHLSSLVGELAARRSELELAQEEAQSLLAVVTERRDEAAAERERLRDLVGGVDSLQAMLDNLRAVEAWLRPRGRRLADFPVGDEDKGVDVAAIRATFTESGMRTAPVTGPPEWSQVAQAARRWMGLEAELSAKQALVLTAGRARVEAGLRLCQAMQDGAFGDKVRSTALVGRHGGDLNEAVRRVLSRFALHYYVRQNLTTELNEDRGICFRLGDGRTHKSLSTGQRNALAISLAVVFSLNRTNSPLGFVCLDDVSSAFDLDNLASDAAIVRTLAYNRDKRHQRQVILATHHDELTTRLMPVLRPPKDRRLKVVEFVDWSRSRGSVVKQWECMPGTGDPAEVLELWEERRRPRSPQNRERTV